ncbi:MAG: hypothetical protein IH598_00730 [Bacteroidales bacterium]|nr:hypothetical protein [Bacteroidales bacterium]
MARANTGILGDFSGRIGNIVVYKLNGKTVMRMRPSGSKKKATPGQQQSRDDFSHVMKYMQRLKDVVNTGFYDVTEGRFAFHSALSANLNAYRLAGKPASAEWLKISEGDRSGAQEVQLEQFEDGTFKITWGQPEEGKKWSATDRVVLAIVNNTGKRISFTPKQSVLRNQGGITFSLLDATPGDELHFFIYFHDADGSLRKKDRRNVSPSQWVGKVVTG